MPRKSSGPLHLYGSAVILQTASTIQQRIPAALTAEDIEAVHDIRVASRRLRTALNIFYPEMPPRRAASWLKDIARLTSSLGAARDCDVQIAYIQSLQPIPDLKERPGVRRLLLRASQKRVRLQRNVKSALASFQKQGTIEDITRRLELPQPLTPEKVVSEKVFQKAAHATHAHLTTLLSYDPFLRRPECISELHAARISAKHLRYCLEIFIPLAPQPLLDYIQSLKKLQDFLGQIHDLDVWVQDYPAFIQKEETRTIKYFGYRRPITRLMPGFELFHHHCIQHRQQTYQAMIGLWDQWSQQNYWSSLPALFSPSPLSAQIDTNGDPTCISVNK